MDVGPFILFTANLIYFLSVWTIVLSQAIYISRNASEVIHDAFIGAGVAQSV
jgi:hypothetical protein